jgi:hypothetical protein
METSNKNIKIGVTSNSINATFELPWDASYEEIVRVFRLISLSLEYLPATIDKYLIASKDDE